MTDYDRIKGLLASTPFIVADAANGAVRLADERKVGRLIASSDSHAILNIGKGIEKFAGLAGIGRGDREFTLPEVAKMMGMEYHLAYHHVRQGVLVPSVRDANGSGTGDTEARFSWADAFAAGIIGSLRRLGLKTDVLRQVQPLFTETKQTPQKVRQPSLNRRLSSGYQ